MNTTTRLTLSLAALLLASTPAWAINKCKGPDGKMYYQDTPCASGHSGGEIDIRPASGDAAPDAADQARARTQTQLASSRQRDAINQGIASGEPVIGMSEEELQRALGAPSKVIAGNFRGTQKDQIVFYKSNGTWYVYTTSGIVESIQFSPDVAPHLRNRPARCPTELELRNLHVSANSDSAGPDKQEAYRRALRDAHACKQ